MPRSRSRSRSRLTVKRLMVAVATVALGLGCIRLWQRKAIYQQLAAHHESQARKFKDREAWARRMADRKYAPYREIEDARRWAEYHASLKRTYEDAAASPWLPVEPDPPRPE